MRPRVGVPPARGGLGRLRLLRPATLPCPQCVVGLSSSAETDGAWYFPPLVPSTCPLYLWGRPLHRGTLEPPLTPHPHLPRAGTPAVVTGQLLRLEIHDRVGGVRCRAGGGRAGARAGDLGPRSGPSPELLSAPARATGWRAAQEWPAVLTAPARRRGGPLIAGGPKLRAVDVPSP